MGDQFMERATDGTAVREYADMTGATIEAEGHDGDYIPDGAKDDSVFYLVVGLVLFLLTLISVVLLVARATQKKKRRQKCSNCGAQNRPSVKICNGCGQPL